MATETENAVLRHGGVGYTYDELLVMGRRLYHNRGESYPLTLMDEK